MIITSGCNAEEAKTVKGEVKAEYVNVPEIEEVTIEGQRTLKVEGLKAQYEAEKKAEQERIVKEKEEAERKAKEEAEAKAKAEAAQQKNTPKGLAKWECQNYKDIHDRANNSTMGSQFASDADYYSYLKTIEQTRYELLMSGECQWIVAYEEGYLYDTEPVEEEIYQEETSESEQTFDEYMEGEGEYMTEEEEEEFMEGDYMTPEEEAEFFGEE